MGVVTRALFKNNRCELCDYQLALVVFDNHTFNNKVHVRDSCVWWPSLLHQRDLSAPMKAEK